MVGAGDEGGAAWGRSWVGRLASTAEGAKRQVKELQLSSECKGTAESI